MDNLYQFKDLAELIPFDFTEPPLWGIWDCYGGGLFRYVADRHGLWLCKQGRFTDADSRLTGWSESDLAERMIDEFGTVYSTKDGMPLLPFPFTAHELMVFNAIIGGLIAELNDRGEFAQEWIAELTERNPDAADLAAVILYGDLPMDAEIYPAVHGDAPEPKEQRQDRRLKACEDAGLSFKDYKGRLPDGVGHVADQEGVTRQTFSIDVKAALKRREDAKREGVTVHRA